MQSHAALKKFAWLSIGAAVVTIALKTSAYLLTRSVGLLSDAIESLVNLAKIRAEANPFDPHWQDYFKERAFYKWFGIHRHEAGVKPSCRPAPLTRGLVTA